MTSRPAALDTTDEKAKPTADEQIGSSDRLSNADYWVKRNKSPKYADQQAKKRQDDEKARTARLEAAPPASSADWIASKAEPRNKSKKYTEQLAEKQENDRKAREAKLAAQPSPDTQSWVENQQPKSPGKRTFDSGAKEAERQKQQEELMSRKPPPSALEWAEKYSVPKVIRKKHKERVEEVAEEERKARERKLAARPSSNASAWISEKSAPVVRENTTHREWPEWGKDPKWNKKQPAA